MKQAHDYWQDQPGSCRPPAVRRVAAPHRRRSLGLHTLSLASHVVHSHHGACVRRAAYIPTYPIRRYIIRIHARRTHRGAPPSTPTLDTSQCLAPRGPLRPSSRSLGSARRQRTQRARTATLHYTVSVLAGGRCGLPAAPSIPVRRCTGTAARSLARSLAGSPCTPHSDEKTRAYAYASRSTHTPPHAIQQCRAPKHPTL